MGLDMYLYAKDLKNSLNDDKIEVIYWRKVPAIHKWFVKNCQDEIDDCREVEVSVEKLMEFLSFCKGIIEIENSPMSFLFEEYSIACIKETIKTLEELIPFIKEDTKFYYRSSW